MFQICPFFQRGSLWELRGVLQGHGTWDRYRTCLSLAQVLADWSMVHFRVASAVQWLEWWAPLKSFVDKGPSHSSALGKLSFGRPEQELNELAGSRIVKALTLIHLCTTKN